LRCRPRWYVDPPGVAARRYGLTRNERFNADVYLPWPLRRIRGVPFAVTNATTSLFFLGFFFATFLAAGLLAGDLIDPTGIVLFLVLTLTAAILRLGLFSRDTVVKLLMGTIMSDEGAKALISKVVKREEATSQVSFAGPGSTLGTHPGRTKHGRRVREEANGEEKLHPHGSMRVSSLGIKTSKSGVGLAAMRFRPPDTLRTSREKSVGFFQPGLYKPFAGQMHSVQEGAPGSESTLVQRMEAVQMTVSSSRNDIPPPIVIPRYHVVTVIFSDIVGFTKLSSNANSDSCFQVLHEYFNKLDNLLGTFGVFKYQTIGDAYLAVVNYDGTSPESQAARALEYAWAMVQVAGSVAVPSSDRDDEAVCTKGEETLQIRVGLHSGPLSASVLGAERPALTLIGDTLNTGSRMESNSRPGHVRMSATTFDLLPAAVQQLGCLEREEIQAKGKGEMVTYILDCNDGEKWARVCDVLDD